jgi:hypothetical protein
VFQGLLDKAATPDELAGVIAHEVGHVAHRDGTRMVLRGRPLLFGILLGDLLAAAPSCLRPRSFCRRATAARPSAADAYGVALLGGSAATRVGSAGCSQRRKHASRPKILRRASRYPRSRRPHRKDGRLRTDAAAARSDGMGGAREHLRGSGGGSMARRYVHRSRPPGSIWARRIAGFAFLASFLSGHRRAFGPVDIQPALATLRARSPSRSLRCCSRLPPSS